MKTLRLRDGSIIQFTDSSVITNLTTVVPTFTDVEQLRTVMTEENLSRCEFDGLNYEDVVLDVTTTLSKEYGNVQVTFLTRTSSDVEIDALRQQIAQLESENASLSDKAEAADILLGNEEV